MAISGTKIKAFLNKGRASSSKCLAPMDSKDWNDPSHRKCGLPATEQRDVLGLVWPLCAAHAKQLDEEAAA